MNAINYFVHESSYIDEGAKVGNDTKIWHFSHVMRNAHIGENCNIGQNVFVGEGVRIGNNVKIQNNVSLYTGVICEDDVFIGPSAVFTNVINPRAFIERKDAFRRTVLKKGATIGANATIICGITIGKYALIGAGTVVTKNIPDYGLIIGKAGILAGWTCQCGITINFQGSKTECPACHRHYEMLNEDMIVPVQDVKSSALLK